MEVLPPRYVGTNKTYTIQVALDGEHFLEEPAVRLTVRNEAIRSESEFVECGKENLKNVVVNYVETGTKKKLAESDIYQGYSVSMIQQFSIAPKQISGYELVKSPNINLENDFVNNGRTYTYEYRKIGSTVSQVKVSKITLGGISKKIAAGKKLTLTAAVSPSNAANKAVTWKSSNTKYATVTSAGKVTVKKAGAGKTVTITATAKDGSSVKATYKIKIMKNAVKSIKLKAAKSVKAGKSLKVKATVKTTGKKVNKTLKWTSSNTKYATVNSKGKVTAKKAGKGKTVKITAKSTDGTNKKKTVKIKIK